MAFLRVCVIAAFAALMAGANANPYGNGVIADLNGGINGYGGYGYGGPGAWGWGGYGSGYGVGYGQNSNAALGNAGININGGGSQVTLAGYAPQSTLPIAETLAVPNVLPLYLGKTVGCGLEWPVGLSAPVGLPFAGQPGTLKI